jgi:predicted RNA binding protein YcfA (HicA-like mRNA interferase family)
MTKSGSHIFLRQLALPHRRITVPDNKEVAKDTLRAIIRQTDLTLQEYNALR